MYVWNGSAWGAIGGGGSGTGFTIGSAISGGTAGRIIFEDSSNQIAQSANLTYSSNTFTVTDSGGADLQHWVYAAATVTRISEVGSLHTLKTQAADAEIDTSEVSWFTNPTNGAPGVGWKGKSNDATVYEVEIGAYTTSAPSTNSGTPTTRYGGDTNYCGDPNAWLVWKINGTTYKIPAYT